MILSNSLKTIITILFDIANVVRCGNEALLFVVVDDWLGLSMAGVQPLLDCGLGVVCSLEQVSAACIAFALNLELVECDVISGGWAGWNKSIAFESASSSTRPEPCGLSRHEGSQSARRWQGRTQRERWRGHGGLNSSKSGSC